MDPLAELVKLDPKSIGVGQYQHDDAFCDEKFESDAPSFGRLKKALTEVRHTVHLLLQEKRKKEPDPVETVTADQPAAEAAEPGEGRRDRNAGSGGRIECRLRGGTSRSPPGSGPALQQPRHFLRKREPLSPAPYLMLRGLRWGELRTASRLCDSTLLEAPSTELRPTRETTGAERAMERIAGSR